MNKTFKYFTILIPVCFLFQGIAFAQIGDPMTGKEEMELVNTREDEAIMESDKPEIPVPSAEPKVKTEGLKFEKKENIEVETSYKPVTPKVRPPGKMKVERLYNNYVKLGFGRFNTPYGKLYLNNGRHDNLDVGLDFTHISAHKGHEEYAEFRDDFGTLRLKYMLKKHTMGAKVYAGNHNFFYYADTIVEGAPDLRDTIRQMYTRIGGQVFLMNNYNPEKVNYNVTLGVRDYFDRKKNNELHIDVKPNLNWQINKLFGAVVQSNLTFTSANFDTLQARRIFFDFTPMATFEWKILRIKAGVKLNSFTDSTTTFGAYPVAEVAADIWPGYITLMGGISGEMTNNQVYDLVQENKYINVETMPNIRPTRERFRAEVGLTGAFAKHFTWSAKGWYRNVRDQLIFYNPYEGSRFDMVYDSAMNEYGGEIGLMFNYKDKIRSGVRGTFRSFNLNNVPYFYSTPKTRVDIWASYNFGKKLYAEAEFYVFGNQVLSIDESGNPINQAAYADLNLSLEYRFSKWISIFLEMNNLMNNKYARWYNYREREFDVRGGVTFAF